MNGWFGLTEPEQILAKLEREGEALCKHAMNADLALNFCVSGFHLIEWLHPGRTNSATRRSLIQSEPLLQVLEHLANGAKHFELDPGRHQAVKGSGGAPSWAEVPFRTSPGERIVNKRMLYVRLDGEAEHTFGRIISVDDLVHKTLAFWKHQLGTR